MIPERLRAAHLPLLANLVLVALGGCARPGAPEGGAVPEFPPTVVESFPDTFAVVDSFDDPVRLEFGVPMSERPTSGRLRDAVVVSPRTGEVSVRHGGDRLEVALEGGFEAGRVYRVSLRPVLQDRFQNRMAEPFDLFFSTGPDLEPNLVAGLLTDRITGQEVEGAQVDAVPADEGAAHLTVSDSTGIFAFPYLPSGRYRIVAYEDRNRSREPDFEEPQASAEVELQPGDTLVLAEMALLAPDTTAAELTEARALEADAVALEFDDHLDPEVPPGEVSAEIGGEGGEEGPGVAEVLHEHEWEERARERAAEEADEAEPDPDDPEASPDPEQAPEEEGVEEAVLPSQVLVLVLEDPLEPESEYEVTVDGVENINGVPGGGGTASFLAPAQEAASPDTTRAGAPW